MYFLTKPFFAVQNRKKGFVEDGSATGYPAERSKGSVEIFIVFLRLLAHLEAFRNLQNLFGGFCKAPLFFSEYLLSYCPILLPGHLLCTDVVSAHSLFCVYTGWPKSHAPTSILNISIKDTSKRACFFSHDRSALKLYINKDVPR